MPATLKTIPTLLVLSFLLDFALSVPASAADVSQADRVLLQKLLAAPEGVDRARIAEQISDKSLKSRVLKELPTIDTAWSFHQRLAKLKADVKSVHGKVDFAPSGPDWLREVTGDEAMQVFQVPVTVNLYDGNNPLKGKGGLNTVVNDDWLKRIVGLTTITSLDLANCDVHRKGLEYVATLKNLEHLNLTLTPVVDDDLKPLSLLTELQRFSLASTDCTGEGFVHLTGLTKLENLNMHHALTNDAGLKAISGVGDLERLWIAHTHFTDAAANYFAEHKNLHRLGVGSKEEGSSGRALSAITKLPLYELELYDRQATDEAVSYASEISTLRLLNISYGPTVTDESMDAIARMPALEEFRVYGAQITDEGIMKLAGVGSLKRATLMRLKSVSPEAIEHLRKARPELELQVQ